MMLMDLIECEPVPHYNNHLCALADRKQMLTLARLAKGGKYICKLCGRVAAEEENVCAATELSQIE